ncbi:MAG: HNH endonuclease [Chitinophagaceae bacterium]
MATTRNPKWHRDEIILALDLYFDKDRGSVDSRNPKVIALSKLLNKLPIFKDRPDAQKFRNPNGVSLKLSNFLAIDPDYTGKGMEAVSKLDKELFKEFVNQKGKLHALAAEIKKIALDEDLSSRLSLVEEDEQTEDDTVEEGQVLYRLHKLRERDSSIARKKKNSVLKNTGRLACQVCNFDFFLNYGDLGKGYIECHHLTPLSSLKSETKTSLDDLALVCANCHRMLHKMIDRIDIDRLRIIFLYNKTERNRVTA